ncbi:hypothetical protein ANN_12497 [Periplaneta americana]|uniref:Uncharacterized protein n=1 Tax=Periplaneta americana TaxID=6978 RepID=A0ABQ8THD0_PERAM|nr:hypothetical protein ANN_12497 [Periplaneta americana]
MSPGSSTESYPAFARIGLRKTPEKPQPGNLPRPGFEPGPPGFAARRADRYSTAGYTKWDHKRNEDLMEELQLEPVINHVKHYQYNWINHLHRMHRDRIPKVMLYYRPNGKRSLGRPKKRWIENSTVRSYQAIWPNT